MFLPGRPQGVKNNETNGLATGETDEIHDKYSIDAPAFDRQHGIDEIHQCCPSQPVFALLKVALQLHLEANRQRCTQLLSLSGCSYSLG